MYNIPPQLKGALATSYHILLGQTSPSPPLTLPQKTSPVEEQPTTATSPTSVTKQSPMSKRQHPSPDPVESMPPSPKRQETPPWFKTLKPSHAEAFSWDSNMVKEARRKLTSRFNQQYENLHQARREFSSKHSYDFTTDGTCNLSRIFRQLAASANLLGTSIYEIQSSWTGPKELKQANYALQSLPKGLKFLWAVPPSESPKVMRLMGIHDPDAIHCFSSITYCPWCGKECQNEGTMVNHL